MNFKLINEDGTNLDYPLNPLEEKWKKIYPSCLDTQYDDYKCMECFKCPFGGEWKVPNEDLDIWNEYQIQIDKYDKIHNPSLYNIKQKIKKKV